MDHDQQCEKQEEALKELRIRTHGFAGELLISKGEMALLQERFHAMSTVMRDMADRTQELVLQYHEQNVIQARMAEQIARMQSDVTSIKNTLETKVASREEHMTLRGQVWWGVGVIMSLFLTAVWWVVVKAGGGK